MLPVFHEVGHVVLPRPTGGAGDNAGVTIDDRQRSQFFWRVAGPPVRVFTFRSFRKAYQCIEIKVVLSAGAFVMIGFNERVV